MPVLLSDTSVINPVHSEESEAVVAMDLACMDHAIFSPVEKGGGAKHLAQSRPGFLQKILSSISLMPAVLELPLGILQIRFERIDGIHLLGHLLRRRGRAPVLNLHWHGLLLA